MLVVLSEEGFLGLLGVLANDCLLKVNAKLFTGFVLNSYILHWDPTCL